MHPARRQNYPAVAYRPVDISLASNNKNNNKAEAIEIDELAGKKNLKMLRMEILATYQMEKSHFYSLIHH
jgi:hypothetical protein